LKKKLKNFKEKLKNIRAVFMDVDGILNDGTVFFWGDTSPKTWFVRDRLGIKLLKKNAPEIKIIWISGRPSHELEIRASELGVDEVFSSIENKIEIMEDVLERNGITAENSMYIGDDLVDLACMLRAGICCCPSDAVKEVIETADFVSSYKGGRGAVREIMEEILCARGVWEKIVSDFKKSK
jgi:3-deoxy-D-manno-octulosonate 8-phosphate phosphatase (KDO 8-P phosphatase)